MNRSTIGFDLLYVLRALVAQRGENLHRVDVVILTGRGVRRQLGLSGCVCHPVSC
jgi:hypothetical protein